MHTTHQLIYNMDSNLNTNLCWCLFFPVRTMTSLAASRSNWIRSRSTVARNGTWSSRRKSEFPEISGVPIYRQCQGTWPCWTHRRHQRRLWRTGTTDQPASNPWWVAFNIVEFLFLYPRCTLIHRTPSQTVLVWVLNDAVQNICMI